MHDTDPRPPLLPPRLLAAVKVLFGAFAAGLAVIGGVLTFGLAGCELWHAVEHLFGLGAAVVSDLDQAMVYIVKSIDAVLLALVQFLLAAYLWQILDPKESLLDEENIERLEEAKQILCKVLLVIIAVRMLSALIEPGDLKWHDLMVFPAAILALSFGNTALRRDSRASS